LAPISFVFSKGVESEWIEITMKMSVVIKTIPLGLLSSGA